jgi:hypothetical protein
MVFAFAGDSTTTTFMAPLGKRAFEQRSTR